jgi:hypothetical protein
MLPLKNGIKLAVQEGWGATPFPKSPAKSGGRQIKSLSVFSVCSVGPFKEEAEKLGSGEAERVQKRPARISLGLPKAL